MDQNQKPMEGEENHQGSVPGKPAGVVVMDGKGRVLRRQPPASLKEPESEDPADGRKGPEGWQGSWGGKE